MQIINNLTQGSAEWHQHRRNHFNASDAPAMMGCSPYKKRAELLREMATGIVDAEIDPITAKRFADGHRFEAWARPLAEAIIEDELAPLVGVNGRYSASFDGLTMDGETAFEHKTLNDSLRYTPWDEGNGWHLPLHYRVQMEHQCMVAGCERILFMASRWTDNGELLEERRCWYAPDPELRARIVAGWEQFEDDVTAYVPEDHPAPVTAAPIESLPAVVVQVQGALTVAGNLPAFGEALRAFIDKIPTAPSTDQEFADTEAACKALKNAEDALEAAESNALAQLADVDTMRRFVADYRALARTTRLQREKLVTLRKDEIRRDIVNHGMHALRQHIAELNAAMPADYMPTVPADFAGAIKGKRTVDSLRDAVDTELARAKIVASGTATRIHANVQAIRNSGLMVPDAATLVLKATDDLEAILAQRVAADKARIEAERERIATEERAKAEAAAEADRARIRAEEQEKARREAEAQAAQREQERQAELARAVLLQRQEAVAPAAAAPAVSVPNQAAVPVTRSQAAINVAAPAANEPAPGAVPTLGIGAINERLRDFKVSEDGLRAMGFEPGGRNRAAPLYFENQFPAICAAIAHRADAAAAAHVQRLAA